MTLISNTPQFCRLCVRSIYMQLNGWLPGHMSTDGTFTPPLHEAREARHCRVTTARKGTLRSTPLLLHMYGPVYYYRLVPEHRFVVLYNKILVYTTYTI